MDMKKKTSTTTTKNSTRRIRIKVVIMKKTRSNRDENASVQGKWFE